MSKKAFKTQASSSRALSASAGAFAAFGESPESTLSYVYEPPDLDGIPDSEVLVSFKNLQKKDPITKAKALEELDAYVSPILGANQVINDAVLEVWVRLYPRTSIDTSRRVRQLAHEIHGKIALIAGKGIAKFMPNIVGAWLAGAFDSDKAAARSASESFTSVFKTDEKQKAVWKRYSNSIIEFCRQVIFNETPGTLSDERTVRPDEAEAKYGRVLGCAIHSLAVVLKMLLREEEKSLVDGKLKDALNSNNVWEYASSSDPFVRKAVYALAHNVFSSFPGVMKLEVIRSKFFQEAMAVDQTGSVMDFITCLAELSAAFPAAWNLKDSGSKNKKSPLRHLYKFLQKGSQGAPAQIWAKISTFLSTIPAAVLLSPTEGGASENSGEPSNVPSILTALAKGITKKEEPIRNQKLAWSCYFQLCERLADSMEEKQKNKFLESSVLPLVEQYIVGSNELSDWSVRGPDRRDIILSAVQLTSRGSIDAIGALLEHMSTQIVDNLSYNKQEASTASEQWQLNVVDRSKRWCDLISAIIQSSIAPSLMPQLRSGLRREVETAMKSLTDSGGGFYGGATFLALMTESSILHCLEDSEIQNELVSFAKNSCVPLASSKAAPDILRFLGSVDETESAAKIYGDFLDQMGKNNDSSYRDIMRSVASSEWPTNQEISRKLSESIEGEASPALKGNDPSWQVLSAAIRNQTAPSTFIEHVLFQLMEGLSVEDEVGQALEGVALSLDHQEQAVRRFVNAKNGSKLLSRLVYLSQRQGSESSGLAASLGDRIRPVFASGTDLASTNMLIIKFIHDSILDASASALPVDSLVGEASKILKNEKEDANAALERLLPTPSHWGRIMETMFAQPIDLSLSIMAPLGGAIYLIEDLPEPDQSITQHVLDDDGYSILIRLVLYTFGIIRLARSNSYLSIETRANLIVQLSQVIQFATDQTYLPPYQGLLGEDIDVEKIIFDAQGMIHYWLIQESAVDVKFLKICLRTLLNQAKGTSSSSYYNARAYVMLALQLKDPLLRRPIMPGIDASEEGMENSGPFQRIAIAISNPYANLALRSFNFAVASLTRSLEEDFQGSATESILHFSQINGLVRAGAVNISALPTTPLILMVRHIVQIIGSPSTSQHAVAEALNMFAAIFPALRDIYDDFWDETVQIMISRMKAPSSTLPIKHGCLCLLSTFRNILSDGDNEDLEESWTANKTSIIASLYKLLEHQSSLPDSHHQPCQLVNRAIARHLLALGQSKDLDSETMFPIVGCESISLQQIAYHLLHNKIPQDQIDISVEAVVDTKFTPKIPDELLSLIAEQPPAEDYTDLKERLDVPTSMVRYLLSWKLIFDHWINASYIVQSDYANCLNDGAYIKDFLEIVFIVFNPGDSQKRKFNLAQYDIENYDDTFEDHDSQTKTPILLAHVCCLCFKHVPLLVRKWWRNDCPRAIEKHVEDWTAKHISPLVIKAELATVSDWDPNPGDLSASEPRLEVTVSPRSKEVTASYPVDETHMIVRFTLPSSYPLQPVSVSTVRRVAVDEKKWATWLNTSQIVANFAPVSQGLGAIVDGLTVWRRNVVGAMRSQSECAICYSVVSPDQMLPTKKCGTCKNCFHGQCLFRWFKTSSTSSCPLCRNPFNYA